MARRRPRRLPRLRRRWRSRSRPRRWTARDRGARRPTVAGGTPPYVYLWQKLSGSAYIYADNPTGATTRFRWSGSYSGPPKLSNWRCQVTDSASVVAYSDSIRVGIDPSA